MYLQRKRNSKQGYASLVGAAKTPAKKFSKQRDHEKSEAITTTTTTRINSSLLLTASGGRQKKQASHFPGSDTFPTIKNKGHARMSKHGSQHMKLLPSNFC